MKKKIIFFCTIPFVFLSFVACSKTNKDEDNIVLGDIELDDGTIELGEIEEFENSQMDGVINYEEELQNTKESEETKEKSEVKESTKETSEKKEETSESKKEETKKSEEKTQSTQTTEESKEKKFDPELLKDKTPEEIYEWYLLNVQPLDFSAEENQNFIKDYYIFVDKKYNTEGDFADFFFEKAENDNAFDFYFLQKPEEQPQEETTETTTEE